MTTIRSELEWFWYLKRNPTADHPFVEGLLTDNCANCNKSLSHGHHNDDPIKPASLYERGHYAKTDCSYNPVAFCPADGYEWPCPEAIKEKTLARIDRTEPPGHTMSFDAGTIKEPSQSCDCQRQQITCTCGYPVPLSIPHDQTVTTRIRIGDLPDGSPHYAIRTEQLDPVLEIRQLADKLWANGFKYTATQLHDIARELNK